MLENPAQIRTDAASRTRQHPGGGDCRLVVFRMEQSLFAVELEAVQEIALMARLSTPPGLPPILAGFLTVGRRPIPVVRLHRLLDVTESACGLYTPILLFRERNGVSAGWIVDRVMQILSLPRAELLPVPADRCFQNCAIATFLSNGTNVTLLSPDRLLLEQERQSMLTFQGIEQARLRELESVIA